MSISLGCNIYNDAAALRGLLEASARYFDNLFFVHAGPGGARSTDGTIEILEKFGATVVYDDIQKGFGYIRSRVIHECGCDWCFLMDADERFFPQINVMTCEGDESYPKVAAPNLTVTVKKDVIDQGGTLKQMIKSDGIFAIRTTRRHWFDFKMNRPAQNWLHNRDHQMRIVRNLAEIRYKTDVVMHEQIIDERTGKTPSFIAQDDMGGPFHDHFHLAFRTAYPGTKEFNEQNYDRLSRGEKMIA